MQCPVKNLSKPTLSAPTEPGFEVGKITLLMVQKVILYAEIKLFVDREEIMEENLKRAFTILAAYDDSHCTRSLQNK